jgi:hypothetical protein
LVQLHTRSWYFYTPEAGISTHQKLVFLHTRSWFFYTPEAGISTYQKLVLLHIRKWYFYLPEACILLIYLHTYLHVYWVICYFVASQVAESRNADNKMSKMANFANGRHIKLLIFPSALASTQLYPFGPKIEPWQTEKCPMDII